MTDLNRNSPDISEYGTAEFQLAFGGTTGTLPARAHSVSEEAEAITHGSQPGGSREVDCVSEEPDAPGHVVRPCGLRNIAALWYEHWNGHKSARYVTAMERRMKGDILPTLGSRPIANIEAPEVVAMVKRIEARGANELARRALEVTSQIFRYAIANGLAQRNPAADVRPTDILKPVKKVTVARVDAKELPALLAAIKGYGGSRGSQTSLAMRLMAYTFVRTGELIGARWDEINLDDARWDIPSERMKKERPHIVPLSRQAVELLKSLRQLNGGSGYVFRGVGKGHMSSNTILLALERLGYRGKMTGHGFRGVASTLLHEQGWPHDHIEIQLAHAQENSTSAVYNHALYISQRREMMQAWADYLDAQLAKAPQIAIAR